MTPVVAIRYPDGTIRVPVSHSDAAGPVFACGTDVLRPGDDGYDYYAARAVPAGDHDERRRRDPVRAARLKAEFKRRYAREHARRSA
ncbi:hypothetical protein GCM10027294_22680 [Marinactinospora endophytica]